MFVGFPISANLTISFAFDRRTGLIIVFASPISISLTVSVSLNRRVSLTISFALKISVSVAILPNLDLGANLIILVVFHDNRSRFYHFIWFG